MYQTPQVRKIALTQVATTITLLLASCGPKARIVGEVDDNFGRPLAGVEVSIPSTALKTTTNKKGEYTLAYVAGKFSVNFSKDGYIGTNVAQDVAVETTVPLQAVVLYKRPPTPGLWFFGSTDYVPLAPGRLVTSGGDRRHFAWVYNMSYQVTADFPKLPRGKQYKFFDNHPSHLVLLKVGDNGLVATRSESFNGFGQTRASVINDDWKQLADGVGVRQVSLTKGRYAYVATYDTNYGMGPRRFGDPVYAFEVQ